ncbi:hypothetical protein B0H10DRAFT_1787910, partial [Mycena sp. CBHHK59/15]
AFQFNVEGAILGVLEPLNKSAAATDVLPFMHFLATRFLPCGPVDVPVQKFTGNIDCGDPPKDDLTMAIHAFSHYIIVFTDKSFVLCDLQGKCLLVLL